MQRYEFNLIYPNSIECVACELLDVLHFKQGYEPAQEDDSDRSRDAYIAAVKCVNGTFKKETIPINSLTY